MFCGNCGTQNTHGGKFCSTCGSAISNPAQSLSNSAPVTATPTFAPAANPTPPTAAGVPGQTPFVSETPFITTPVKKKKSNLIFVIAGVVLLGIVGAIIAPSLKPNPLVSAVSTCDLKNEYGVDLSDGNKTLTIDTAGDSEYSGTTIDSYICIVGALNTPTSITSQIEQTSALDGWQYDTADGLEYYWGYSSSEGLYLEISIAS